MITDGDWHSKDSRVGNPLPIYIEDNVWIGLNVLVMKGVTIGQNSIIGAGSVVTKDIPANVIAAGNPCKVIKEIK
ncbi:MAG: DapH/DapD/GlmU-related protein [Candidatus Cloacimonadaceae bacterium]|nr:DapH/DapD/GlmU-related protein [Candidatus Cloacimonadaceae bacterium]